MKSVLLDAPLHADADRLVRIHGGSALHAGRGPLSAGTVDEIAARQQSFTALAAFVDVAIEAVYGREDGPQIITIAWVEPQSFDTLGVSPCWGERFVTRTRSTDWWRSVAARSARHGFASDAVAWRMGASLRDRRDRDWA